jgi:hypothetical protein
VSPIGLADAAVAGGRTVPSVEALYALPATVDLTTAGAFFGLGRDGSYAAHQRGDFPVPVLRLGRALRVTRASLLAALDPSGSGKP